MEEKFVKVSKKIQVSKKREKRKKRKIYKTCVLKLIWAWHNRNVFC